MSQFNNPFADYGNIVWGERFIGRAAQCYEIESRVIAPPGANLAIIGQRRVGKSSLAYQAVMTKRNELLQSGILPIRITISTYTQAQQFYVDLVAKSFRQLEDLGWTNRLVREAADEVLEREVQRFQFGVLKDFFNTTQTAGFRIILILDEFDRSSRFFADDEVFFDRLRELSYGGQTTLLTISRNPISHIEKKANITSTLAGIFHDQYLGMFNESESKEHFRRLAAIGIPLVKSDQQRIEEHCGGHPYLLDRVGFEIVEIFKHDKTIQVETALHRTNLSFFREFDGIIEHLRERELTDALMQTLFSSTKHVGLNEISELEGYGLIRRTGYASSYQAFSANFENYLRQKLPMQLDELTTKEQEVLYCLSSDMQNKEIARQLHISENTVKTYVTNIYRKLQSNSRQEAVRRARELDLLE